MKTDPFRLQQIGVRHFQCPITVLDRDRGTQSTVASVDMHVELPHELPPQAENRLIEIIGRAKDALTVDAIGSILAEMKAAFAAESAHLELVFPYFVTKSAPESGAESVMDYECRIVGRDANHVSRTVEVRVPVTLLLPHDGTGRGTRNQRCVVTVTVRFRKLVWIEELIAVVERHASSELYALLKRPDEKAVTLRAYENPMTLHELVRRVAGDLEADDAITWFSIRAENLDSVHNHNTYASLQWTRPTTDTM